MIDIVYNRSSHNVSASGHACSNEMGKDLVCSAVSILFETLALNCIYLAEQHKSKIGLVIDLRPGNALISIPSTVEDDDIIRYTFDTLCCGFEFLAKEFPEYINYTLLDSEEV